MSFLGLHELAAARGDGLHPQLRALFERLAKGECCEIGFRADGMLQAGPDPISAKVTPARPMLQRVSNRPSDHGHLAPVLFSKSRRRTVEAYKRDQNEKFGATQPTVPVYPQKQTPASVEELDEAGRTACK